MKFLNKVVYAKVWELLVILVVIVVAATIYRIYLSRAVALTQVCERLQELQNDEIADVFNSLGGEPGQWLKEVNRLCEIRRPIKETQPSQ
jgi:predicted transcriptional regulator